ncbi:tRNA pseudouridine(38-40) synthase TruA [Arachidicoccus terrestris]|uniref:tRNA pseudouridine(38-40) synthase TruA n=1 Tax=Arachidicoccus terrestris TaxID=2875539 RepID=UPI001CC49ED0|nr:tRNA pseudouridine(38-40) synthase TruA [Arachidicoccus terrestris]UAY56682.1 tRNA pseudouridine(38-40) synthase TruA [Arachidicoccus terrestris]
MAKYFLELSYMGTHYNGFQVQPNVPTIQGALEKAMKIRLREDIELSTSSRTDAGVHARQNFFHFETATEISQKMIYNLNAILPRDISITNMYKLHDEAHSRFDALGRKYRYYIYNYKNPFMWDRGWYYPFNLDIDRLNEAAAVVMEYEDFTSFSKRNTQVHTYICQIRQAVWEMDNHTLVFTVEANRFLRGMVRALVATMLKVSRGTISIEQFRRIIESKNCANADFSAPAKGLFLEEVSYPYKLTGIQ